VRSEALRRWEGEGGGDLQESRREEGCEVAREDVGRCRKKGLGRLQSWKLELRWERMA
jgi:hypothetical protein